MSSFILRIVDADVVLSSLCKFGFRKWKSHVTERPFEKRSDIVKELYSELNVIKPHSGLTKLFLISFCSTCIVSVKGLDMPTHLYYL